MQATIISRTVITLVLLLFGQASWSATVLVAVAANFSKPMIEIVSQFEKATGHSAQLSFGSSGKFISQLENGGPFEVLLSADEKGPEKLEQAGLTVPNSRFVYALGKLVLWSSTPNFVDDKGKILMTSNFKHLALADPKVAPYGAAAIDVLKKMNLLEKLQPLFVQGENIAQTYQFISTANAELGFLALSQVIENGKIVGGSFWIIPDNLHAPIRQGAVLMKKGAENPAARALIDYLKSIPALAIIKKYGYDLAK
jgi:molybdate transport system substrate-binding protein